MDWHSGARGQVTIQEWQAKGWLSHADPYLLWSDLTNFAGSPLPGKADRLVPVIELRQRVGIRSHARVVKAAGPSLDIYGVIARLADPARRLQDGIGRFEVATGFRSDDPGGASDNNLDVPVAPKDRRRKEGGRPVVGIIDYGCAFAHANFRRPGSTFETRVKAIWDQGAVAGNLSAGGLQWRRVPTPFLYGAETHRDRMLPHAHGHLTLNQYIERFAAQGWLNEEACYKQSGYSPVHLQEYSHGTAIMDLATGWPSPARDLLHYDNRLNAQHEADIVFVQLPRRVRGRQVSGLLRANVLDAVRYILDSTPDDQPVVINLSYGANAGPHDGTSLLEQGLDKRILRRRRAQTFVVVPAGNARKRELHAQAVIAAGATAQFHWNSLPDDPSDSFVEFWFPAGSSARLRVTPPGAQPGGFVSAGQVGHFTRGGSAVAALIYPKKVCQSETGDMVLLASASTRVGNGRTAAPYGRWIIEVCNDGDAALDVHAWCERDDPPFGTRSAPRQSHFTATSSSQIVEDGTLNSLAHGRETVVVGGRVLKAGVAQYSGTGPGRGLEGETGRPRHAQPHSRRGPDFLEPSEESPVLPGLAAAALLGQGKLRMNGTSVAAALLTRRIIDAGFQLPPRKFVASSPAERTRPDASEHPDASDQPARDKAPSNSHPDEDLLP